MSKNPFVTQEGLAGIIGIHVVNIKKTEKFQESGMLKRVGSDKSGKREIINDRK